MRRAVAWVFGIGIKPPPHLRVSNPMVIDIDTDVAYINIGLAEGIRNGNKFGVWDAGESSAIR